MRGGGQPYWNEDTQDWEDDDGRASGGRASGGRTSAPPPVRPAHEPVPVVELGRGPGTAGRRPVTDPDDPDAPNDPDGANDPDGEWPPSYPPARRPAEWSGRGRRTRWTAGAGALAAVVVVTLVTVHLTSGSQNSSDGKSGQGTVVPSGSPSTDGTPTASAPPSATDSPSVDATAVPVGYRVVHDTAGFTIAVPDGWQRDERTNSVFYTIDGDRDLLQIYPVTEPDGTPYKALQDTANERSGQPGYEQLGLEQVAPSTTAPGQDAAELVYVYDNKTLNQRRQVVDYAFTAPNGTQYAVLVAGSADEWPLQQSRLNVALAHFAAD
ncbi:hypothetical protein OK074_4663 [Actinobacteria bacterium OK074]|nr:hypothetical protein OK074_4663 [Actinobacteria bacterium OK074]